jgi:hypothetical protein
MIYYRWQPDVYDRKMFRKLLDQMVLYLWYYLVFLILMEVAELQLLILVFHLSQTPSHQNNLSPNHPNNCQHHFLSL